MKNKIIIAAASVALLVILCANFWPGFRLVMNYLFIHNMDNYQYSSLHGEFKSEEDLTKGTSLKDVERGFKIFKERNSNLDDTHLYRKFKKSPLHFWDWSNYLFNKRYGYPYLPEPKSKL